MADKKRYLVTTSFYVYVDDLESEGQGLTDMAAMEISEEISEEIESKVARAERVGVTKIEESRFGSLTLRMVMEK